MNHFNQKILIGHLTLNSGERLENINIAYKTFGQLNADKSNAILICHSLSSNAHVCQENESDKPGWWDCIVGQGKYIDTTKYFVICINNLGGCFGTSGPTSINPHTGKKYGHEFPRVCMNDIVNCHQLVINHLGIKKLHAVVGSSMGGMLALEWAIAYPEMVKRLVSISSCATPPASVIAAHAIQRDILMAHTCESDDECHLCHTSFKTARKVGLLTYKCTSSMNQRFKQNNKSIEGYLEYNADKFIKHFNRESYLIYLNAMDNYQPKNQHYSFDRITASSLIISVDSDVLFPQDAQEELYQDIFKFNQRTQLIRHSSPHGHDAFFKDEVIGAHIKQFISQPTKHDTNDRIEEGILSAIGNTPLIQLTKIEKYHQLNFNLYAKLEAFNPGGSIKDRPAKEILLDGLKKGIINKDTTIIEYSSGNMGIGLSQVCCYLGLEFICVCDTKTTDKTKQIMQVYGTKIILIKEPDPVTNEFLPAAYEKIRQLMSAEPNSFWVNQHGNLVNAAAHYHTFSEIHQQLEKIDYLFCATSTCGTLRGCSEYIKQNKLNTKIIAVDALGSSIFSNNKQKRLIPGHGAGLVPAILKREFVDDVIFATAQDSVWGARHLLAKESILAGGSTGAVLSAILAYREHIAAGSRCVMIAPDRGERYLDTIYNDLWCTTNHINLTNKRMAFNE